MFEETNPNELIRLLHENNISYVAIDNDVRNGDITKNNNESVYQAYFPKVFDDTENKYNNLKIYQITASLGSPNPAYPLPGAAPGEVSGVNVFTGGSGSGNGQFTKPRGLGTDSKGNIYVVDQGNNRVQKFDAEGKFLLAFGTPGDGDDQFKEVSGVTADAAGNVWVVDAGGDKSKLMKFTSDGKFVKAWKGTTDNSFYGPRDLAIGPNKMIYIVDQGHGRIVRFDPATEAMTQFGTLGSGDGQFHEATGICTAGNFVVVADGGNNRIEVFDLDGKFVRQWNVPMWQSNIDPWHWPDVAYDDQAKKLYATSGWTSEVLVFDLEGKLVEGGFKPDGPNKLDNPSSLVISDANKSTVLLVLQANGSKVSQFPLRMRKGDEKERSKSDDVKKK
jgi:DNA-binding beta-propeller fold protein YncE